MISFATTHKGITPAAVTMDTVCSTMAKDVEMQTNVSREATLVSTFAITHLDLMAALVSPDTDLNRT